MFSLVILSVIDVAAERTNFDFAIELARAAAKHKLPDVLSKVLVVVHCG